MKVVAFRVVLACAWAGVVAGSIPRAAQSSQAGDPVRAADRVVGDTRFHYLEAGRGPAVLLLHGFTQTSEMWRPVITELAC